MWLCVEVDNRALYPNEVGNFNLRDAHLPFSTVLGVEGPSLDSSSSSRFSISSTAQSSATGSSSSFNSASLPPAFKFVIPKSKEQRITVKIIQASMEYSPTGKVDFTRQAQM